MHATKRCLTSISWFLNPSIIYNSECWEEKKSDWRDNYRVLGYHCCCWLIEHACELVPLFNCLRPSANVGTLAGFLRRSLKQAAENTVPFSIWSGPKIQQWWWTETVQISSQVLPCLWKWREGIKETTMKGGKIALSRSHWPRTKGKRSPMVARFIGKISAFDSAPGD